MLAAILRFADELSDDRYRASSILQELKMIPDSSVIYHKYAECLNSVMIRPQEKDVSLHFHINIKEFVSTFPKKRVGSNDFDQVYLLDEIFNRILKAYDESLYCNRFTTPFVDIRRLSVEIKCLKDNETIADNLPEIKFSLYEKGYPSSADRKIHQLAEELKNWSGAGIELNGKLFAKEICAKFFQEGLVGE